MFRHALVELPPSVPGWLIPQPLHHLVSAIRFDVPHNQLAGFVEVEARKSREVFSSLLEDCFSDTRDVAMGYGQSARFWGN